MTCIFSQKMREDSPLNGKHAPTTIKLTTKFGTGLTFCGKLSVEWCSLTNDKKSTLLRSSKLLNPRRNMLPGGLAATAGGGLVATWRRADSKPRMLSVPMPAVALGNSTLPLLPVNTGGVRPPNIIVCLS